MFNDNKTYKLIYYAFGTDIEILSLKDFEFTPGDGLREGQLVKIGEMNGFPVIYLKSCTSDSPNYLSLSDLSEDYIGKMVRVTDVLE